MRPGGLTLTRYTLHPWQVGPTSPSFTWLGLYINLLLYCLAWWVRLYNCFTWIYIMWLSHGLREPHSRSRQDSSCYKDGMHRLVVTLHFTVLPRALGVTAGAPVSHMDIALKPRNPRQVVDWWCLCPFMSIHFIDFRKFCCLTSRCVIFSTVWIHSGEFKDKDKEEEKKNVNVLQNCIIV